MTQTQQAEIDRRYAAIREAARAHDVDAVVVSGSEYSGFEGAVRYLSGFRILHLTDLHLTRHWWPAYDELHNLVRENPPNVILCTGDFVDHTWKRRRTLPVLRRFIDGLSARLDNERPGDSQSRW